MKIFITEKKKIYYEGQKLSRYDLHDNFIENVEIVNFFNRNKKLYVRLQSIKRRSIKYSLKVEMLDSLFKKYRPWEEE